MSSGKVAAYYGGVNRLAELRAARELTQAQLATKIGAHPRSIRGWEAGRVPMPPYQERLAKFFKVTIQELGFEEKT